MEGEKILAQPRIYKIAAGNLSVREKGLKHEGCWGGGSTNLKECRELSAKEGGGDRKESRILTFRQTRGGERAVRDWIPYKI